MKKTALYNKHIEFQAKMIPFAGYEMPVQYSGVNHEHINVRNNVGVFDVSHMGEFLVKGENALKLIQKISSNDASTLFPGKAQYNYLPNDNGGIIDDLIVYQLEKDKYLLVVNASNIEKDWKWINGAEIRFTSNDQGIIKLIHKPNNEHTSEKPSKTPC